MSEAKQETAGRASPKRRFGWLSISLSAFIMSFTGTMINAFYALRGSEIVIQEPRQLLLYRDGEGENAVLSAALRLELINTAKDYGDVLLDTRLIPYPGGRSLCRKALLRLLSPQTQLTRSRNARWAQAVSD